MRRRRRYLPERKPLPPRPPTDINKMYEESFRIWGPMLRGWLKCDHEAEDVYHIAWELFLKAYRRGQCSPGYEHGYFRTIIRRQTWKRYHEKKREIVRNIENVPSFDKTDLQKRHQEIIEHLVKSGIFPEPERRAVGLCWLRGYNMAQAGRLEKVNRSTISRRLAKAQRIINHFKGTVLGGFEYGE